MAEHGKGTIMGRSSCDWVHDWLPLLVDDSDGLGCEGSDLIGEDRRLIEQHLRECAKCCQHQAALQEAFAILGIAAADMTVGARAPSLWPKLEERIQHHHEQARSRWIQAIRAICPARTRASIDRFFCGCSQFRSNLPLHLAWTRDSVGDFLADRGWASFLSRQSRSYGMLRSLSPRLIFGLSLAAAAMVLLLLAAVMQQRRQIQAEAPIAAETTPWPRIELPLPELPEPSEDVITSTSSSTVLRASNSPSLATSAAPGTATSMGQAAAAKTASTVTTTTATATTVTSVPRYDFDLEHGTPMPPETRTGKPAY